MSIVKNTPHYLKHSQSTFTTILNKTIEAISDPAALGIYIYLASKPDNWEISATNLKNRFNKGGDFIRSRLAELKRIGLLKSVAIKDEKGKIIHWETVLYNEPQTINLTPEKVETQNVEKPPSGENTYVEKPHITNKRDLKIKDINNHTHSVECDLFLDEEQKRKALILRAKTLKNEKCKELYEQLSQEIKKDKSFEDVHDECVTHYATQQPPQMVSPQRLMSWINRDIKYNAQQQRLLSNNPREKSGDAMSRAVSQYLNQGATYDQQGNTIDQLR